VSDEENKQDIEREGRMGKGARPIDEAEKEAMREAAPTQKTELMVELLWQCGFRAEEAATVELESIDLENREITVNTVKRDDHQRSVQFDVELKFMLDRYLDVYRKKVGRESPFLFVSNRSDHPMPQNFSRTIKDLADDADIQSYTDMQNDAKKAEITPHSFRKSLGIRLDEEGASMKEIAETLGHSDTSTVSTYLDIS
jgi:integrase/recombinase XerD